MGKDRKWVLLSALAAVVLLAVVTFFVAQWWRAADKPLIAPPLAGRGSLAEFPKTEMIQSERERFLEPDFMIVKDVKAFPQPVLQRFTEQGGSRVLMANPGKDFNTTDVIYDESIPRMRLIFAGVAEDKFFVLYGVGGVAHMYILAFFRLTSKESAQPLWRGHCGPAGNLQDLRSLVRNGKCSEPVPYQMLP
jgi:hypothetical protein